MSQHHYHAQIDGPDSSFPGTCGIRRVQTESHSIQLTLRFKASSKLSFGKIVLENNQRRRVNGIHRSNDIMHGLHALPDLEMANSTLDSSTALHKYISVKITRNKT